MASRVILSQPEPQVFNVISLLLLSACGQFGNAYGDEVLPKAEQLEINLQIASDAAKSPADPEDWATFYEATRSVTEDVNGVIGFVLGTVALVVSTQQPSWVDDDKTQAMWGPYSDSGLDPTETGIMVTRLDDDSYDWTVFQVPNGGTVETDSVNIVTGHVNPGATAEVADGTFTLDYTAANALDPAVKLTGTWDVTYAYDESGVAAEVTADDYGWESWILRDATYAYIEDYAGAGEMDLAYTADVNGSGTTEIVTLKSRWQADGMGRGDAELREGDVSGDVTANECWGTDFKTSYWTDSFDLYDDQGSVENCAFAEAEYATEATVSETETTE